MPTTPVPTSRLASPTEDGRVELRDPDARAADLERYCQRLVARLCRSSWVLRRDQEDLLQEARLLAWQHGDHPVAERVIKLRLIDRVRVVYGRSANPSGQAARRVDAESTVRSLDEVRPDALRATASDDDVEAVVIGRDAAARVRRGLARLSSVDRTVVLDSVRGATLQDMAGRLELSESGVSRRRRAARARLREALAAA